MKPRIIGFDLDDVLLAFNDTFYPYWNKKDGTNFQRKDITSFSIEKIMGCTKEEMVKKVFDFYESSDHAHASTTPGALEAVKKIAKGNTLVIITSKPEQLKEMTLRWLDVHFPTIFQQVYFTNHFHGAGVKRPKGEVCKELGVEIFIDDSLEHAHNVSEAGIPVLLFDAPWNQAEIKEPITRVHSWDEIVEKLVS